MPSRNKSSERFELPDLAFVPDDSSVGCPTGSPAECGRDNYTQYQIQRNFIQHSLYGPDQLRQRVAFALHQILVIQAVTIEHSGQNDSLLAGSPIATLSAAIAHF